MKQTYTLFFSVVILSLFFIACNKKNQIPETEIPESIQVSNPQLKEILINKGYEFNDTGNLVLNEQVQNLTILDLSGTELSDASGLDIFPSLTEVDLSNNNFYMTFDFAVLPANITGINLVGNEIYEYPGLVNVVIEENDDETVSILHTLTKLYLPASAKYNCFELVHYFEQHKAEIEATTFDMQMNSEDGLLAYNTLREVPNIVTRRQLNEAFPSFFEGDYIDLSKRVIQVSEITGAIGITSYNAEGTEYILHHRSWKGTILHIKSTGTTTFPYLNLPTAIAQLSLTRTNTPNGIYMYNATNIYYCHVYYNTGLDVLDLSPSTVMGQRDLDTELEDLVASYVVLHGCLSLTEIKLPPASLGKTIVRMELLNLPLLESLNLSQYESVRGLKLALLPEICDITMFTPVDKNITDYFGDELKMGLQISKDMFQGAVKDHLDLHHNFYENSSTIGGVNYTDVDGEQILSSVGSFTIGDYYY